MRAETLELCCCPECYADLALEPGYESDGCEITRGSLRCDACGERYAIDRGLVFLTRDNHEWRLLRKEAQEWGKYADWDTIAEEYFDQLPYFAPSGAKQDNGFDADTYWGIEALMTAWNLDVLRDLLAGVERPAIWDIGVQSAWTSKLLAKHLSGARVIASDIVDQDNFGLGVPKKVFFDRHDIFFERFISDVHWRNLKRESMDAVYAAMTLHHFEYLQQGLDNIASVLKPDGVFCAAEPIVDLSCDKYTNSYETDNWVKHGIREMSYYFTDYYQFLANAGFKDIRMYPYFLLDERAKPDGYNRDLMLPYYPMPQRYVAECRGPRKALFDMMASFEFREFTTPFYVFIYASKTRSLEGLDRVFLMRDVRARRLVQAARYEFMHHPGRAEAIGAEGDGSRDGQTPCAVR
ncbi:MAG: methyltransferase domain-containing protein [Myxococcales bacterium]|nr:methyltransferase domain-containing protein [Myxococcales bacterium]